MTKIDSSSLDDQENNALPFGTTLRKLLWILPVSFAVPVLILLLAVTYVSNETGPSATSPAMSASAIARRIAPVGRVVVASSPAMVANWNTASLSTAQTIAVAQEGSKTIKPTSAGGTGTSAMLALAKQKNCLACHSVDAKIVGPSYKALAEKYACKPGAEQMLVNAVLHGHVGTWGQVPMPPNTDVTPAQAKQLVAWILSLK